MKPDATLVRASRSVALGAGDGLGCHKSAGRARAGGPAGARGAGVAHRRSRSKDAKIEVAAVAEQDVDDTILTSGRVTFDDLRSAHVFSPVTGRVVKIVAAARRSA